MSNILKPIIKRIEASEFVLKSDESTEIELCFQNNDISIHVDIDGDIKIDRVYLVDEFGEYSTPIVNFSDEQLNELLNILYPLIENEIQEYENEEFVRSCLFNRADEAYEMYRDAR